MLASCGSGRKRQVAYHQVAIAYLILKDDERRRIYATAGWEGCVAALKRRSTLSCLHMCRCAVGGVSRGTEEMITPDLSTLDCQVLIVTRHEPQSVVVDSTNNANLLQSIHLESNRPDQSGRSRGTHSPLLWPTRVLTTLSIQKMQTTTQRNGPNHLGLSFMALITSACRP